MNKLEKQILIKVDPEFKKKLKIEAAKLDITVKDLIIKSVNMFAEKNK